MESQFALGWNPVRAAEARREMMASGRYCTVSPTAGPAHPAYSLSQYRLAHYEQGQAGTCWVHAAKQLFEVTAQALGYSAFPACRMLIGYEGKRLEGGGNPTNGGVVSDAIRTMLSDGGVGAAHEDLDPYSADSRKLGSKPPQAVYDDAKKSHLAAFIDVSGFDQIAALIDVGKPTGNGIWWPYGWDSQKTIMDSIGSGTYGHALLIMGYAQPGVLHDEAVLQIDNWHGLLYPPLPASQAAKVPGYTPISQGRTSDFWVTRSAYERVVGYGNSEHVSATDLDGLGRTVLPFDMSDLFPV